MLWALALLGLLPTAFMFSSDSGGSSSSDSDESSESSTFDDVNPSVEADGDLLSDVVLLDDDESTDDESTDDDDDVDDDDVANVEIGSGETVFPDFEAGVDQVDFSLDDGSGTFIIEPSVDEDGNETGTSLSYETDDGETTLTFLGYDDLPVDDIFVNLVDPDTGETTQYALDELGDFGALDPNDPDEPAVAGGDGDENDVVATEVNPDEPATAGPTGSDSDIVLVADDADETATGAATGATETYTLSDAGETLVLSDDQFQGGTDATIVADENGFSIETEGTTNIVTGGAGNDTIAVGDDAAIVDGGAGNDTIYGRDGTAILSGGEGDDTIYAGNDTGSSYILSGDAGADTLVGGDGDDLIIMDAEDTVSGGDGEDTFWLNFEAGVSSDYATVDDFASGEDVVLVTLDAGDGYTGDPEIEVSQTEDGLSSQVTVDGEVVAVLAGTPNATVDDVIVELA